jgi:hypothetical protein
VLNGRRRDLFVVPRPEQQNATVGTVCPERGLDGGGGIALRALNA